MKILKYPKQFGYKLFSVHYDDKYFMCGTDNETKIQKLIDNGYIDKYDREVQNLQVMLKRNANNDNECRKFRQKFWDKINKHEQEILK